MLQQTMVPLAIRLVYMWYNSGQSSVGLHCGDMGGHFKAAVSNVFQKELPDSYICQISNHG